MKKIITSLLLLYSLNSFSQTVSSSFEDKETIDLIHNLTESNVISSIDSIKTGKDTIPVDLIIVDSGSVKNIQGWATFREMIYNLIF